MRVTKVVTKKGDKGKTSLVGGAMVSKASTRVEAYGDVDELNSFLGLARTEIKDADLDEILRKIQNGLFTLGADLASSLDIAVPRIEAHDVSELEGVVDTLLQDLEPLKEFILPGGSKGGSLLHVARTIARRAERRAVKLSEEEKINKTLLVYLNRLSDLLFVLARVVNKRSGLREEQASFTDKNKKH